MDIIFVRTLTNHLVKKVLQKRTKKIFENFRKWNLYEFEHLFKSGLDCVTELNRNKHKNCACFERKK